MLDISFRKLYQIAKVEGVGRNKATQYRVQENQNFTYEECFAEEWLVEPSWIFAIEEVFNHEYEAIKKVLSLYDKRIQEKVEEYKKIKNSTVVAILDWDDLFDYVRSAIGAMGGKWPKPPLR